MTKTLLILEAPSKAKKVQTFLNSNYIVKASVGHIRDLPLPKNMTPAQREKYGDFGIDVSSPSFDPLYKNSADKAKVIKELKDALAKADELILMTDDDNEGHAISWHLLEALNPKVPVYRAVTNEITQAGVAEGLKNKMLIDVKKREPKEFFGPADSALTRSAWDRMYGFATSPYVWKTIKPGTSSGRVQTPGARLVVERELERLAFKSVNFYSIHGEFEGTKARLIEFKGQKVASSKDIDEEGKLKDGVLLITDDNLSDVLNELEKKMYGIGDIKQKPYRRSAPPPFMTSSALQSIGGKTGMSSKQLTSIFQGLYQNGDVTYIRTVSVEAAPEAIAAARKSLESLYGKKYVSSPANAHKDKKQGNSGHECIRPTLDAKKELLTKKFSDPKVQKVFEAIYRRMLASQAIDCTGTTWTMLVKATDKQAVFSASETEIHEPGWTKVYSEDDEDGDSASNVSTSTIKNLQVGAKVDLSDLEATAHKTTPPARFTEVSLIKKLAELGIGRPATFNSIVTVIQDRGYVMKVGNQLIPTFLGFAVVKLLMDKFPVFTDYNYTATMEEKLDEIADLQISREKFLDNFWNGKTGFAATVDQLMKSVDYEEIRKLTTVSLHNGYHIVYNKFGAWLQQDDGPVNDKGYPVSAKLSDGDKIDEYLDADLCAKLLANAKNPVPVESLGVLPDGTYKGWTLTARSGKYGDYVQAQHPDMVAAYTAGEKPSAKTPKPINHALPEGVTLEDVKLEDVAPLFAEIKLPRWSDDQKWMVGIGKKGQYMGMKATPKGKLNFKSLDAAHDPRTIDFADVKKLWDEAEANAPAKPAAKKAPAKKAPARKK